MGVYLVTGASKGIGRSLACLLADKGHQVILLARNSPELDEALEIADRVIVLHEGNLVGEFQNESKNVPEIVSSFSGSTYKQDSPNYGT